VSGLGEAFGEVRPEPGPAEIAGGLEEAFRQVREDLRDPGAVTDRVLAAVAERREVLRRWLEVFEAILDVAAFSTMPDETEIPIWPHRRADWREEFAEWPKVTVGMVRQLAPILQELAR